MASFQTLLLQLSLAILLLSIFGQMPTPVSGQIGKKKNLFLKSMMASGLLKLLKPKKGVWPIPLPLPVPLPVDWQQQSAGMLSSASKQQQTTVPHVAYPYPQQAIQITAPIDYEQYQNAMQQLNGNNYLSSNNQYNNGGAAAAATVSGAGNTVNFASYGNDESQQMNAGGGYVAAIQNGNINQYASSSYEAAQNQGYQNPNYNAYSIISTAAGPSYSANAAGQYNNNGYGYNNGPAGNQHYQQQQQNGGGYINQHQPSQYYGGQPQQQQPASNYGGGNNNNDGGAYVSAGSAGNQDGGYGNVGGQDGGNNGNNQGYDGSINGGGVGGQQQGSSNGYSSSYEETGDGQAQQQSPPQTAGNLYTAASSQSFALASGRPHIHAFYSPQTHIQPVYSQPAQHSGWVAIETN